MLVTADDRDAECSLMLRREKTTERGTEIITRNIPSLERQLRCTGEAPCSCALSCSLRPTPIKQARGQTTRTVEETSAADSLHSACTLKPATAATAAAAAFDSPHQMLFTADESRSRLSMDSRDLNSCWW